MSDLCVRPLAPADHPRVTALFDDFQDFFIAIDPLGLSRRGPGYNDGYFRETLKNLAAAEGFFLVAEAAGEVVGFIAGQREPQTDYDLLTHVPVRAGRVTELYIDAAYRGQGVGAQLIAAAEARFRELGCAYVWIEAFVPNANSVGFYRHLGYADREVQLLKKLD